MPSLVSRQKLAGVVLRETYVNASLSRDGGGAGQHLSTAAARGTSLRRDGEDPSVHFVNRRECRRVVVVGTEDIRPLGVPDAAGRDIAEQQLALQRGTREPR